MKKTLNAGLVIAVVFAAILLFARDICRAEDISILPFRNPMLSEDARVADLMSRLTMEEKLVLMNAGAGEIARLGIKPYHYGSEALHGIAGPGNFTVFPQAIAIAATWDTDLVTEITTAISDEAWGAINAAAAEKGYPGERFLSFWSPTINMARDPRWGRTPETYGEDPYLTARTGVAFVKGLQGDDPKYVKAVASPKHFVANNEEHNRFRCDARISERTLREYYFPGFKAAIQEGGAQSVMAAYNAVNGIPCNANNWLLTTVLRDEWGFDGYVVTDCDAPKFMIEQHRYAKNGEEAASFSINAGVDIECGGDGILKNNAMAAMKKGMLSEAAVNLAVERLLRVRLRLGMFDPPEMNPYSKISPAVISSKEHIELARQVSRESIALLKNDPVGGAPLLPLDRAKIKTIAVVGPNAAVAHFGDYSGKPSYPPITPLEGINNKAGGKIKVNYVEWVKAPIVADYEMLPAANFKPVKGARGVTAQYFKGETLEGKPAVERTEEEINLSLSSVPKEVSGGVFTVRWSGTLTSNFSGIHYLYLAAEGDGKIYVDGLLIHEKKRIKKKVKLEAGQPLSSYKLDEQGDKRKSAAVILEAGKPYAITVEYRAGKGESVARLDWVPPAGGDEKKRAREIEEIKNSDVVIALIGLWRDLEHENIDRVDLDIPYEQTTYLKSVKKLNPDIAAVLINGSAVSIGWEKKNIPAIVEAWYPGEQGGNAIADVLFGDYNPAGRLPLTFYSSVDDLPRFNDYEVSNNRTYMYFEGEPLFPFGHGLSYTAFEYSNLVIADKQLKAGGYIDFSMDVANTGGRDGDEVVQIYVRDMEASVKVPKKQLRAFRRVGLKKGEKKTLFFRLAVRDLGYWDEKTKRFVVEPGEFELQAGASSKDIRLKDRISVTGE